MSKTCSKSQEELFDSFFHFKLGVDFLGFLVFASSVGLNDLSLVENRLHFLKKEYDTFIHFGKQDSIYIEDGRL